MQISSTLIDGAKLICPVPNVDDRGFFVRTFDSETYRSAGIDPTMWVQHNQSRSTIGTVRGIHFRTDGGEYRLVRCARGAIFDVVVDLRPESSTYGAWEGFVLDDEQHHQLLVPPGCGHGFQALSDVADTCYQHSKVYTPQSQGFLRWNDADIEIRWPAEVRLVADRDNSAPTFAELSSQFAQWFSSTAAD
jgi:dTDP-4-dehydrorhamnose 3,5-epimerase